MLKSLRSRLVVTLVGFVLIGSAVYGGLFYWNARNIVRDSALRSVASSAESHHQSLITLLQRDNLRALHLLEQAFSDCRASAQACRRTLLSFVVTENALYARMDEGNRLLAQTGTPPFVMPTAMAPNQLAAFGAMDDGRMVFGIRQRLSARGQIVVIYPIDKVQEIFSDRAGLGSAGEAFLVDATGQLLTEARHAQPARRNMRSTALGRCLAGERAQIMGQDYAQRDVVQGFAPAPEIGNGCVMANIEQAEAFAAVNMYARTGLLGIAVLAGGALLLAFWLGKSVSTPLMRLNERAQTLKAGDLTSPVPIEGPSEIRLFAETFASMARHLDQSLRAQAESEQRYRAVAELASSAIYIHDGRRFLYVNKAAEQISGFSREELMQMDLWDLVHPDHREWVKQRAKSRFEGKPAPARYEFKALRKDGREIWLDFSAVVIQYDGRPAVLATAFDVTEQKAAAEQLRLTEKLAATGRMAATIAHEINNPLEAVTNLMYLASSDPYLTSRAREFLRLADQELKRVTHIAQQTLGFFRETSQPVKVTPVLLLDDVLRRFENKIEGKRIQLKRRYDFDGEIEGLRGELTQVFSNLIANAVDASPEGGELHIRTSRAESTEASGVRIMIADQGPGIPAQDRSKVFEPFFTTKKDIGTGLGLWVTKSLVEKHGGTIHFRSRDTGENSGTVFCVFLPGGQPAASSRPAVA